MASIYLHLGRGDAFPLSVEEAMLAGLPAIVSDQTGSKELVEAIGKNFVVPMQQEKIVKAVTDYFSSSYKRKIFLSKKAISASQKFSLKSEAIFNKKFKVSSLGKKDF
jgi:glycosyltransferase involved in cell wall biosynthesis